MSTGLKLLRAMLSTEDNPRTIIRQLKAEMFVGDEEAAFEFIREHYRNHGELPKLTTVRAEGIVLPKAPEPASYYLERVKSRSAYNKVRTGYSDLADAMQSQDMAKVQELVKDMNTELMDTMDGGDVRTIRSLRNDVLDRYREVKSSADGLIGIPVGYSFLDQLVGGAEGGDIWIKAARPGTGKTYDLLYSMNYTWTHGYRPMFISMEMTVEQIARRFITVHGSLNPDALKKGRLSTHGERKLISIMRDFDNDRRQPVYIVAGNFRKTVADVDALIQEYDPDIVYIDAAYLLSPRRQRRDDSRRAAVSDVVEELKQIAVLRNKPMILTVQLNRSGAVRGDQAIALEHIAETDVLAQVATVVVASKKGRAPNETTQRRHYVLKDRDGGMSSFTSRFEFTPINFEFLWEGEDDPAMLAERDQHRDRITRGMRNVEGA